MSTLGEHLVEAVLPPQYQGRGPLTKQTLHKILVEIAKDHPDQYPKIVTALKRLGDEVVTLEGVSVGLDDIMPDKAKRDEMLAPHLARFNATKDPAEKEKALLAAQKSMLDYTQAHPGTMGEMVRSGGRGSPGQLMKIIATPTLATDEHDKIVPWPIRRSYSEGLTPAEAWVAGNEARINAIKSQISVAEPGDMAKIFIANMSDKLVTTPDCGTTNGLVMRTDDASIIDRYLAHAVAQPPTAAGTLITPQLAKALAAGNETIVVRSPMTCQAPHGICQKCQGLSPSGRLHPIGTNVGMRAAQAMAEPLTQLALSSKHGGATAKGQTKTLDGIKGVRQVLEIPSSFLHRAVLAAHDGTVGKIEEAPQGGHYVWVDGTREYVPPDLNILAKTGQTVEAGDALSDGIPKPDEVVQLKGLGQGRQHVVDTLHGIYKRAGVNMDRRHFETLARSVMNHVYIADPGDGDHGFLKGDIVDYNRFAAALASNRRRVPLDEAVGETLADATLHFTAGTRITPSVRDELARRGIHDVNIASAGPRAEPIMRAASRTPLLNPDWMARLAHRYLKESLIAGATRGDVSNIHSFNPVPAYAAGTEFGQGEGGAY